MHSGKSRTRSLFSAFAENASFGLIRAAIIASILWVVSDALERPTLSMDATIVIALVVTLPIDFITRLIDVFYSSFGRAGRISRVMRFLLLLLPLFVSCSVAAIADIGLTVGLTLVFTTIATCWGFRAYFWHYSDRQQDSVEVCNRH